MSQQCGVSGKDERVLIAHIFGISRKRHRREEGKMHSVAEKIGREALGYRR